jgi:iron complex transport system substrate-binding protein
MSRALRTCIALVASIAVPSGAAADSPRRIVSFNVCADQLLIALADPKQIAGLSPNATNPAMSAVAERARAFPQIGRQSESVIPLNPDLVLTGPGLEVLRQPFLRGLGFSVVPVELINDIVSARAQIRQFSVLFGHPERGEALVAEIDAAHRRLIEARRTRSATALLVENGGYTVGPASLAAALMQAAGLEPPPGAPTGLGGIVPLEKLIALRPDYLVMSNVIENPDGQGALYLTHPGLRDLYPQGRRILLPRTYTLCGGPSLIAAFDYLAGVVTRLPPAR